MTNYFNNSISRLSTDNNVPLTVTGIIRNNRRYLEYKRRLRRRISIAVVVSLVISVFSIILFNNIIVKAQTDSDSEHYVKGYTCITINSEDTLWAIASNYADEHYSSIYEYIREVKDLNGLTSDKIHSGSKLIIPIYVADNK